MSTSVTTMPSKVKIKLFHKHFAWIHKPLLLEFNAVVKPVDRINWIQNCSIEDFNFNLKTEEDITTLDELVKAAHYLDKSDWLREKIRLTLKAQLESH